MSDQCMYQPDSCGQPVGMPEGTELGPVDELGQATAEYALLTGAIALVIAAVTAWAAGTGKIGRLLDLVFDHLARAIG